MKIPILLAVAFLVSALQPVFAGGKRASLTVARRAELLCRVLMKPSANQLVCLPGYKNEVARDQSIETNILIPGYRHFVVTATKQDSGVKLSIWWQEKSDKFDFGRIVCSLQPPNGSSIEFGRISGAEEGTFKNFPANPRIWEGISAKLTADALKALGYDPETGRRVIPPVIATR